MHLLTGQGIYPLYPLPSKSLLLFVPLPRCFGVVVHVVERLRVLVHHDADGVHDPGGGPGRGPAGVDHLVGRGDGGVPGKNAGAETRFVLCSDGKGH